MRLVLTGLFFPMAILRFFERALQRREDVELFTFGPYAGSWIPWNGGMHLPGKYATPPNLPMALMSGQTSVAPVPFSFVEDQLPWQPDLWLQVDAGFSLTGKPRQGLNFIVATDPHVLSYDRQRKDADRLFCMQKVYAQPGDEYLPYAYDPTVHYPLPDEGQTHDATLVGLAYDNRMQLAQTLLHAGVQVETGLGPVFDEYREIYCAAPIALSWSSRDDLIARVFEGLAMRRLVVCNHVTDLPEFFEDGVDLVVFRSLREAVEKVRYYLAHRNELDRVAASGHAAVRPHTYDARLSMVLEIAEMALTYG